MLAVVGILGIVGSCAALWTEHHTIIELPAPSGPYPVGRLTQVWSDARRPDALDGSPATRTELIVWIWYPATQSPAALAPYQPAEWRRALVRQQGVLLSTFLMRDLSHVQSHSSSGAPLSPREGIYPVVILRAGLGALTTAYTTLAEGLASHGYIVVGFDAPYRTGIVVFPDGRVVARPPHLNPETLSGAEQSALLDRLMAAWVRDIGFVVDRLHDLAGSSSGPFAQRLDMKHLGVVGHSLGGASAAQFCHDDVRCRAGVDLDGALHGSVVHDGLRRPFMFLTSDHGDMLSETDRRIEGDIRAVYDRLPSASRVAWRIRGADHFSCSDQLLMRSPILRVGLKLEPRRGLEVIGDSVRRFLDVYLKERAPGDGGALPAHYSEVQPMFSK
jgi:predicted dienelactone hydrolase